MEKITNTPAIVTLQMTIDEYMEMREKKELKEASARPRNLVYGLEGIKQLFGCSTTTAWRIKTAIGSVRRSPK
jgi:hypothetical protein